MSLGLYISVPFCRSKCSYCNFASGVASRSLFDRYIVQVCREVEQFDAVAEQLGAARQEHAVDSVYLGGGTPTILEIPDLDRLFATISRNFQITPTAEITVECAPGTLTDRMLEAFPRLGINRISLGVQSFVDQEARAVGRLHTRAVIGDDMARLRSAGISNINIDLIAGLPHQGRESWDFSLHETVSLDVPHVSVYMLEIDEDSRLGRELLAGGTRYHAHFVPEEDITVDLYEQARERLDQAGTSQYEISNFARPGWESRHNLKYWERRPYVGFGVDAHSMLPCGENGQAVRFATADSLEAYLSGAPLKRTLVSQREALEETFFLGLRLVRGVDLQKIALKLGDKRMDELSATIHELVSDGLLELEGDIVRLTSRGRLLSNEVFERFLSATEPT